LASESGEALDREIRRVGNRLFAMSPKDHSRWVKRVIFKGEHDKPHSPKKARLSQGGKGKKSITRVLPRSDPDR